MRYKPRQFQKNKSGFTLVELGIGVVIVGMLIGGLLIGQSLVESAKITQTISQLRQYNILISQFKSKFKKLPGDMNNATTYWGTVAGSLYTDAGVGTYNGDGDGTIDDVPGTSRTEAWRLWEHLYLAGYVSTPYTGASDNQCTYGGWCAHPGVNLPRAPISKTALYTVGMALSTDTWNVKGTTRQIFFLGSNTDAETAVWNGLSTGRSMTTTQALSFDKKMDDGMPYTGKVNNMGTICCGAYARVCTNFAFTTTTKYNTAYVGPACLLLIDADFN